eukprot:gene7804-8001_t
MNPYAGLNGLAPNPAAARLLQQPNAGMPNGLSIQGSLPMDDMKAAWMQGQASLMQKAGSANPNLMGLAGSAGVPRMHQQLPGAAGLQGLQQVANGGMPQQVGQAAGLGGVRLDSAVTLAGMGLGGIGGLPGGSSSSLNNFAALASGSAAGPSRQATPPPGGSPSALGPASLGGLGLLGATAAAGATGEGSGAAEGGGSAGSLKVSEVGGAAALMGSAGLPLTASPEHVEAFLKTVGKRFAAMGLTIEQALEFNILKGLTKEQLAVLSESQSASMPSAAAAAAEGSTALPVAAASDMAVSLPTDLSALGASSSELGLPSALAAPSEVLPAGVSGEAPAGDAPAGGGAREGHLDEDDDDKRLESLLESEDKPSGTAALTPIDEATASTLLAMAQVDANFNAFTYGFFDDPSSAGGLGELLGELEPEGGMSLEDDPTAAGLGEVCDLSALSDFEPLDPAQLASWGSIDTGAADGAALAAALAASGVLPAARPDGDVALADVALAAMTAAANSSEAEQGQEEKASGAEPIPQEGIVAEASADLHRLSLGAGFE